MDCCCFLTFEISLSGNVYISLSVKTSPGDTQMAKSIPHQMAKRFAKYTSFPILTFATIEKIASERKLKGSICSNSRNSPINCQESSQKNPIRNGVCHKMSISFIE